MRMARLQVCMCPHLGLGHLSLCTCSICYRKSSSLPPNFQKAVSECELSLLVLSLMLPSLLSDPQTGFSALINVT